MSPAPSIFQDARNQSITQGWRLRDASVENLKGPEEKMSSITFWEPTPQIKRQGAHPVCYCCHTPNDKRIAQDHLSLI